MDDNQSRVDRLFTHHYVNRYEGSHVPLGVLWCARDFHIWPPSSKNKNENFQTLFKSTSSSSKSKLECFKVVFGFWWQIKKASIWSLLRLEGVFCRYYEVQVLSFIPIHFWSVLICSWLIRIVCFSWSSSIIWGFVNQLLLSQLLALLDSEPLTANHG